MRWFDGSIPDAIQMAKAKGSVFIVYIAGEDEESTKMEAVWQDSKVVQACESADCVAIRILSNSEACGQFSMFCNNGIPLEVTGGALSATDFRVKVQSAVQTNTTQQSIKDPQEVPTGVSPVQHQKPAEPSPSAQQSHTMQTGTASPGPSASSDTASTTEKVERAKKLIAEKQAKKAQEEREKAINEEKERRSLGQGMLQSKQRKEAMEARELQNELRKKKEEDRLARQRVKEQIARDRAEKMSKYNKEKEESNRLLEAEYQAKMEAQQIAATELAARRSEMARIQFRLPDGSSVTETFPSGEQLSTARDFIAQHLDPSFGTPVLTTIYPKKSFTETDMGQSFSSLLLSPSSVIMVLPAQNKSSSSSVSPGRILLLILAPLFAIWNFVYNWLFPPAHNVTPRGAYNPRRGQASRTTDSDDDNLPTEYETRSNRPRTAYKRRTPASVSKQEGNIHKFSNAEDDDDETATWNGNSTQQM